MSDLFGGVENFTPAFTGRQLAIAAGSASAGAFTSGMNAGSGRMNAETNQRQQDFSEKRYNDQISALKRWEDARLGALDGYSGDY
jgi:hypothetical protein